MGPTEEAGDGSTLPRQLGVYRIESRLGQGGMGEVYLAWDELLERHVAIKRIRTDRIEGEHQRARFRREARAVARLNHPAIVQVFHILERDDGDCLVMEHVKGNDLSQIIAAGGIDPLEVIHLGRQIAEGLGEAHTHGMVHRDLKLANVMVTQARRIKILDFGLAKALWPQAGQVLSTDDSLTHPGMLIGTAHAMSPEQACGSSVDHRSDLFALGSLLYELISGHSPFRGDNLLDSLRRVLTEQPEPIVNRVPEVPQSLTDLIAELMAKDRNARPANARLVAARLSRIADKLAQSAAGLSMAARPHPAQIQARVDAIPADPDLSTAAHALPPELMGPDLDAAAHFTGSSANLSPRPGSDPNGISPVIRTVAHIQLMDASGSPSSGVEARKASHDLGPKTLAPFNAREISDLTAGSDNKGRVFVFEHPAEAVALALSYHRVLAQRLPKYRARIGIHLGEVVLWQQAQTGLHVEGEARTAASRLSACAADGQTLLNRSAFDLARGAVASELVTPDMRWLAHGSYLLSGIEEPMEIFEVGAEGLAPLVEPPESHAARRTLAAGEELALGWRPAIGQSVPRRSNWQLSERLGEGGFGEVWLARHKSGTERVFKFCFEADRLRALKREVTLFRLLKETLGHRPDIARILDWDFDDSPFFLEAEYTDGGNLATWADRRAGLSSVPLTTRLELVAAVAEALAAAHSVGVLHKDVKPQNILIAHDSDGRPQARLTDFGIGLVTERARLNAPGFTVLGFTETTLDGDSSFGAGTVRYMAPELLEGRPATIQADIYALGVLLYQMVLGDFKRTLAPGWRREIDDPLLAEDIAACVDGMPDRRLGSALDLAGRLRSLDIRHLNRDADIKAEAVKAKIQRRRRIASWLGAVAGLISVIIAIFAYQTLQAKHREQTARQNAEQRRRQAETLIDFLLGDLRQDLQPIGKLDILDKVGDQAMEYFAAIPEHELSDDELSNYSKALHQIGQVRFDLGRIPEAGDAFRESLARAESLAARDPENTDWQFELGQSHFWLGFLRWQQRDLDAALGQFEAYQEISKRLADRDPENATWQLELAYAYSNIGSVYDERGLLEEATTTLEASAKVFETVIADSPEQTALTVEVAHVYAKLGQTLFRRGELSDSLNRFRAALSTYEKASSLEPEDTQLWLHVATAQGHVGDLLAAMGDPSGSLKGLLADLEIAERRVRHDPQNLAWKEYLALRLNKVGRTYLAAGDSRRARQHLERDRAVVEALIARNPEHDSWRFAAARNQCAWALFHLKTFHLKTSHLKTSSPKDAVAPAKRCRSVLRELLESNDYRSYRWWSAQAHSILGEAHDALGDHSLAAQQWRAGIEIARPLTLQLPLPVEVDSWVRLLLRAGNFQEAEPWIRRLTAMGYRDPAYIDFVKVRAPHQVHLHSPSE